ncbi:MAG: sigma-70 family RNA polymerase sigma factor [Isosphaerales bacterium]
MARVGSSALLPHLHTLFNVGVSGALTDGQLLERFVARDLGTAESAFETLVARHGPMVQGVCRRILRDPHDAADAFQATFLVLVRRAATLQVEDSLGGWLHEVSRRIAMQARSSAARRSAREVPVPGMESMEAPAQDPDRGELLAIIDEEIARLPEKYRVAVVLCDLEGLSHPVVARQLGCPVGTIESRLSRGRERLRIRLTRRGLASWAPAIGVVLPDGLAPVSVSRKLVSGVVQAAVRTTAGRSLAEVAPPSIHALAAGFLKTMIVTRIKVVLFALTPLALGALGMALGNPLVAREPLRRFNQAPQIEARAEPAKPDLVLGGRTAYDPDKLAKIRPRFDTLVEKVRAELGQKVKKGDPLIDLFSTELAAAKNDFQTAYVQHQHDLRLLDLRQKRLKAGAISRQLLVDTQNDENKSRLAFMTAGQKLAVFGVPEDQVDSLIKDLGDPHKQGQVRNVTDKARLTRLSPVDGIVIQRDVVPGNLYDNNDVLMVIAPLDHFFVWMNVNEADQAKVSVGQDLEIRFPYMDRTILAKVQYVASEVSKDTRAIKLRACIPNVDGKLKADMLVRVRLRPIPPAGKRPAKP